MDATTHPPHQICVVTATNKVYHWFLCAFSLSVLAVSNLKVGESAKSMYPDGPRAFTFRLTPPAESLMGLLFIPPGRGRTHEHTDNSFMMFYVVSGKVNV
jgi:hypothetical protein